MQSKQTSLNNFLKVMPYLPFFFLFFANLLQAKLFCHLSLMSFPLLIKEKGSQHSINADLNKKNKTHLIPSMTRGILW